MSALRRFFVDNIQPQTYLEGEEFEHAKNVLRIGVGAEIILLDNSGKEYTGVVAQVEKKRMLVNIVREEVGQREPLADVYLLFGYLKNADKNEFIVQKAVELGVNRIAVFSSAYSSAYVNDNKIERLNKVSKEAAKQCLRSFAPKVEYFPTLTAALESANGYKDKLFACEFAEKSDIALTSLSKNCAIVIGSEGGFSREEAELAQKEGYAFVSLGKRILRAETAAISLTAVVMHALGEWQ